MSNDATIKSLREKIAEKRLALGHRPNSPNITNCVLDLNGTRTNILTLTTESECVVLLANMLRVHDSIKEASKILGVATDIAPTFGNYTIEEWTADIRSRLAVIRYEAERKKLSALDGQLAALMSEDAKTADAIADITKTLGL